MTVIKRRVDLPVIPVICEMLRPHHASGNTVFLGELYAYLGGKHGEKYVLGSVILRSPSLLSNTELKSTLHVNVWAQTSETHSNNAAMRAIILIGFMF